MPAFLRRFLKRHYLEGVFSSELFMCRSEETGVSLHIREGELASLGSLPAYQRSFPLPSGHFPGICEVDITCFGDMETPVVAKRPGNPYGEQHRLIEPCPDLDQAAQLATCAILLLEYRKSI